MGLLKVIEIMANSPESWEAAAANAVAEAARTVKNIRSVYVQDQSCTVQDGVIQDYRVTVKITFAISQG